VNVAKLIIWQGHTTKPGPRHRLPQPCHCLRPTGRPRRLGHLGLQKGHSARPGLCLGLCQQGFCSPQPAPICGIQNWQSQSVFPRQAILLYGFAL